MEAVDVALRDEEARRSEGAPANVLMLGLTPAHYVLRAVRAVRSNHLEAALTVLPFPDALKLLEYVPTWVQDSSAVRATSRPHLARGTLGSVCVSS